MARLQCRVGGQAPLAVSMLMLMSCQNVQMAPADAEALYQRRFALLQAGNLAANYDPTEVIAGTPHDTPLPLAAAAQRSIDPAALAEAREYAAANRSTALLVWRDGLLEAADYFGAAGRNTEVNSLSLAKPLAVIAVGRAIMLRKIKSVDDLVADYIREWRGTPKAAITIRELLQMRSGLLQQDVSSDPASPLNRAYLHPYHDRILVNSYPMTDTAGDRYAYSNANAELVAVLIERATGRRYAQFLSQQVLLPLHALGGRLWIDRPHGLAHSGCCIQLPAETWLRLGILVLQNGNWDGRQLLSHDFVKAMSTPSEQNPHAGMGLYIAGRYAVRRGFGGSGQPGPKVLHAEPYLAADLELFDGNADQVLYIVPSANLVALRVGAAPPREPEWDNAKLPNVLLRGIDWHGLPPAAQPVD